MKITLDYLKGITDALYYSQTPLLGGEIEDEKEFEMDVYKSAFIGFRITFLSVQNYRSSKFENDLHEPIIYRQAIELDEETDVCKLVKDIITEMEVIYKMESPEVID